MSSLLSKDEVQTITLNAKFVHKYGDQSFFLAEINNVAARLQSQPFLGFFVRYHDILTPQRYTWSRVRRVVLMESLQEGSAPSSSFVWRGKVFWIAIVVEAVRGGEDASSGAKGGNVDSEDEVLVTLPQLSNTAPTEEEVAAFCIASERRRSTECYTDGPLSLAADRVGKLGSGPTTAGPGGDSTTPLRHFLPTPQQIQLLGQYRKQCFAHHQWTAEEIEESKQLRRRFSSIGVAAAPVQTVAFEHQQRAEAKQTAVASPGSGAGSLPASQSVRGEVALSQFSAVAPTPSSATPATPLGSPLSPFLPRSLLRLHQQQQQLAADGAPSFSQISLPELSMSQPVVEDERAMQHRKRLREAEESFFQYISNEGRSSYLNKIAAITRRNSAINAERRRRGIANERRLERKGNLLESRGLWITDDKERASQADDYIKSQSGDSAGAKKPDDVAKPAPATAAANTAVVGGLAAAAAGGAVGAVASAAATGGPATEAADGHATAEDLFLDYFKTYYSAQRISFNGCTDSLLDDDADVAAVLQERKTTGAEAGDPPSPADRPNGTAAAAVTADTHLDRRRRAGRILLPNRLRCDVEDKSGSGSGAGDHCATSPNWITAQLVHRSTVRMAKRERKE